MIENTKYKRFLKRIGMLSLFSILLLILGTFYDLEITYELSAIKYINGVYAFHVRPLSRIIELVSEWPTVLLFALLMYIIKENIIYKNENNKKIFLVNTIYVALTMIGGMREWGSCFIDVLGDGKLRMEHYVSIFILTISSFLVALHFFKKIKKETIKKYYTQSILIFCTGMLIFFIFWAIKATWGRIRLQDLLLIGSLDGYTPWYKLNFFTGGMSFPSGHAAKACVLYLLIICFEGEKFKKQRNLTVLGVTIWLVLVCTNRLFTASHYLTDIVVGVWLALLAVFVSLEIWDYMKCHEERF